ncbi:unnamed protein product [Eretmochelys imbricata]
MGDRDVLGLGHLELRPYQESWCDRTMPAAKSELSPCCLESKGGHALRHTAMEKPGHADCLYLHRLAVKIPRDSSNIRDSRETDNGSVGGMAGFHVTLRARLISMCSPHSVR